ncbi:MAG: hypothetical protein HQL15_10390 [Candidatus Omnitrophica bacterium]|nr:hypothetical protein [Candidatus Omnitrophota bacterium]
MAIDKNVKDIDRYKDFFASSCIKLLVRDIHTKEISTIIVGSSSFAEFYANAHGFQKSKNKNNLKNYQAFLNTKYLQDLASHRNLPLDVDMKELKKSTFFLIANKSISFEDLSVQNEQDFINKYFDFNSTDGSGTLKNEYYEKYTRNPTFISLLIDLGYDAVWGDYIPNLNIYTKPFVLRFKRTQTIGTE